MIVELQTHIQLSDPDAETTKYDAATLKYLVSLSKIFENGLLSRSQMEMLQLSPTWLKGYTTLKNGVMKP